jgi:hypothetical protein
VSAIDVLVSELLQNKASDRPQPLIARVDDAVAAWLSINANFLTGSIIKLGVLSAGAGNYIPDSRTVALWVRLWGAGGGGGGALASAGNITLALGGSAGAYGELLANVNALVVPIPYSIAVGGAGGDATGANGTTAADSTFGPLTAGGGGGGVGDAVGGSVAAVANSSVAGGSPSGGNWGTPGQSADVSVRISGTVGWTGRGGPGAFFPPARNVGPNQNGNGPQRCSGGGAGCSNSAVGRTGGKGGDGFAAIVEFA